MNKSILDSSLSEELPYWDFYDDPTPHVILKDGSLVSGLEVGLSDIECFDGNSINQLTVGLRTLLNSVTENTSVQFLFSVDSDFKEVIDKHQTGFSEKSHPLIKMIADARHQHLKDDQTNNVLYRPKLHVFVRTELKHKKKTGFLKKPEDFKELEESSYHESLEILDQNLIALQSSLTGNGFRCEKLERSDFISLLYRYLNPKRSKTDAAPNIKSVFERTLENETLSESPWLASSSPREQISFGDLVLDFDNFILDSHIYKVITLKTLPEVTYAGMLSAFLRMPFHYDLILSVHIPPQADEITKLNQKRKMAHSLASSRGNQATDLESESKLSSTEELIRELLNSGQRIYAVQMSIILKEAYGTDGKRSLERKTREIISRFRGLNGAEGLEESVGSWKIFKGDLPLAPLALQRARKMKTNNLADFLPVYGPREGDSDPVVIFRNRLDGLISYNPFDSKLPNYNSLVTGSSGAGKSFLNNCILLQEFARNLRVFIIDIGGSYRKLTHALDGQYLEVNLSDEYRINPFDLPDPKSEPSNQKIKSLLAVCESMVTEGNHEKLPKLDRVLLEKAIIDLYEEKRKAGKIPFLSDLANKLEKSDEPSLKNISKMLYMWTGNRPYGRLLDGEGSLKTNSQICTFDLKGLSSYPDLQSVMIIILTDFILNQVESDKEHKKRIILDEAWQLLQSPAAASFMEYCARTLRKTGSGITFITQGVEEIVSSPIGSAILNNTASKFVMLQRGNSKILQEALKLNSQELELISSLQQQKGEYSEGFMIEGDDRQVIRVFPSPLEYWLSTSDQGDNSFLEKIMKEEKLSLTEAIHKATYEYPKGIANGRKEMP